MTHTAATPHPWFTDAMHTAGLTTAPCQDCGTGPGLACDADCASQNARDLAELVELSSDGCGCWRPDCGECMRKTHSGQRPTARALRDAARRYA